MDDFYSILGVARSATQVEIKAAFKKLAMEHHPDVSKDPKAHVGLNTTRLETFMTLDVMLTTIFLTKGFCYRRASLF